LPFMAKFGILYLLLTKGKMSTPSAIIEKTDTGFRGIYCHSDGYVDYVGRVLAGFYTTPEIVTDLINLGDLSSLGETLASPVEKYSRLTTTAYMSDREETDCEPHTEKTISAMKRYFDVDFYYVFDGKKWTVNGKDLNEMVEAIPPQ
jgi:hypothetical protein